VGKAFEKAPDKTQPAASKLIFFGSFRFFAQHLASL
jgi:hypothetical protein